MDSIKLGKRRRCDRVVGIQHGRILFDLPAAEVDTGLRRDPLVGVLAIAIPFGAITAKVYSELLDEADPGAYQLLRAAGAGRASALMYGVLPGLLPTATSYVFYRFECSIRSAVILGMIGAGRLGLQLSLSFQGATT